MSEPFEDLYKEYEFAVSEARRLIDFHRTEESTKHGEGHFTDAELHRPDALKKMRKIRTKKVEKLRSAIRELTSDSAGLDIAFLIDEWLREQHGEKPVKWHQLEASCDAVLDGISSETRRGRPKNQAIEAALQCYILHAQANGLSLSAFVNAGRASEAVSRAKQFLCRAGYQELQSEEALAEMLKKITRKKLG